MYIEVLKVSGSKVNFLYYRFTRVIDYIYTYYNIYAQWYRPFFIKYSV